MTPAFSDSRHNLQMEPTPFDGLRVSRARLV